MKKPWFWISAQRAHDFAPLALKTMAAFREPAIESWRSFEWRGLKFQNPLGIAGGVDKDGALIEEWWTFGPGFIEVGTITPQPQGANEGKIIDRDLNNKALWNRMGFPGRGVWAARENLKDIADPGLTPIFVNIGKNRTTPNEEAVRDYAECMDVLAGLADTFVINISSPNTPGLRDLLQPQNLQRFLIGVLEARNQSSSPHTPVLLKLSPDLENQELVSILEVASSQGIDGFIATNTTLSRYPGSPFPPDQGGVSGAPLAEKSKAMLRRMVEVLGTTQRNQLLVSAGGVMTPEDVMERLDLGADLVQVYSALIFEGPQFFAKVSQTVKNSTTPLYDAPESTI